MSLAQLVSGTRARVNAFFSAIGDKVEAAVNKLGLELIDEWRKFYTMYSIWFYSALGVAPDLYNLAVSSGLIESGNAPVILTRIINTVAFFGAATRLIKQKQLETEREKVLGLQPTTNPDNPG